MKNPPSDCSYESGPLRLMGCTLFIYPSVEYPASRPLVNEKLGTLKMEVGPKDLVMEFAITRLFGVRQLPGSWGKVTPAVAEAAEKVCAPIQICVQFIHFVIRLTNTCSAPNLLIFNSLHPPSKWHESWRTIMQSTCIGS